MQISYRLANIEDIQVHPRARAAYDVIVVLGDIPTSGLGAYGMSSSADETGFWVVSGFGWLRRGDERVPILELPDDFDECRIEALAWAEVASCLTAMRASPSERAAVLRAIAAGCPRNMLGLFDVPATRDMTTLRRKLKLRLSATDLPEPRSVFQQAKDKLAR